MIGMLICCPHCHQAQPIFVQTDKLGQYVLTTCAHCNDVFYAQHRMEAGGVPLTQEQYESA